LRKSRGAQEREKTQEERAEKRGSGVASREYAICTKKHQQNGRPDVPK